MQSRHMHFDKYKLLMMCPIVFFVLLRQVFIFLRYPWRMIRSLTIFRMMQVSINIKVKSSIWLREQITFCSRE